MNPAVEANVPSPVEPVPDLREERRIGFVQGMSVTLAWLNVLVSTWVGLCSMAIIPRFREVFAQVRVELPAISMLVVEYVTGISVMLILGAIASGIATIRWSARKEVLVLNTAGTLLSLGWMALATAGCFLPLISLLEGIGRSR